MKPIRYGEGRRMGGRGDEVGGRGEEDGWERGGGYSRWLGKGYQTHLEDNLELV